MPAVGEIGRSVEIKCEHFGVYFLEAYGVLAGALEYCAEIEAFPCSAYGKAVVDFGLCVEENGHHVLAINHAVTVDIDVLVVARKCACVTVGTVLYGSIYDSFLACKLILYLISPCEIGIAVFGTVAPAIHTVGIGCMLYMAVHRARVVKVGTHAEEEVAKAVVVGDAEVKTVHTVAVEVFLR